MYSNRFLYLPSGGIAYEPIIRYSPSSIGRMLDSLVPAMYNSSFEHIVQVVESVWKMDMPISELFLSDFFYLYAQIYILDINRMNDDFIRFDLCPHCKKQNKILVHFAQLNINQNHPFKSNTKAITKTLLIKETDATITFRRRKVKDNIEFGYLLMSDPNPSQNTASHVIPLYLCSQIEKIIYQNETLDKRDYFDMLQSLTSSHLHSLYQAVLDFDNEIGMDNNIEYNCKYCDKTNSIQIFDNILLSVIHAFDGMDYNSVIDRLHNIFSMSRLPIFGSIEEAMSMPLSLEEHMVEAVKKMDFRPLL